MTKDSVELELLAQKIQAQLSPDAEVLHNVHLPGRLSKRDRQIDVLVRQRIGQYEMLIVLDCKDHGRPIDVTGVEAFEGLIRDVGAHRGALICPKGFSRAAKERAGGCGIDLYSPVDTDPHKWQAKVTVPMICDFRSAGIAFDLRFSAPMPMKLPYRFYNELIAFDEDRHELGLPMDAAMAKWNDGKFPTEVGEHSELDVFAKTSVLVDNGYDTLAPVEIRVSLLVSRELYFGALPLSKVSGFKDELSGKLITNAFTTGIFNPIEIAESWTRIASEADAPIRPVMKLTGLWGYDAS